MGTAASHTTEDELVLKVARALANEYVYWAPYGGNSTPGRWLGCENVAELAANVATACRSNNNICWASNSLSINGRHVRFTGLGTFDDHGRRRDALGWSVHFLPKPREKGVEVIRSGYEGTTYDSFSALQAAAIAWTWIAEGDLPSGLETRPL